jgi:hypothetical protein
MGMGKREEQQKQEPLWIAHAELAAAPGHPFYEKLNELLDGERFDPFVEALSAKFYAPQLAADRRWLPFHGGANCRRLETQLQLKLDVNTLRETQLLIKLAHATSSQSEMLHFEIERGGYIILYVPLVPQCMYPPGIRVGESGDMRTAEVLCSASWQRK